MRGVASGTADALLSAIVPALVLVVAVALACPAAFGATRYDPALHFRRIQTPHFIIYYHQGEEELALRFSGMVEGIHADLTARLQTTPRGRTHVILVDQTDLPNGWASPLPYDTIEITATWPTGASIIGNTQDWLRLAFTHEYTHILHLDRSRSWAAGLRRLFGRAPYVFPNLFLPQWQIEGIATFDESRATGEGRVPAPDFAAIIDQAARQQRLEPLDRVNGGLVDWPSGDAPYAYGAYFHQYLADRFGDAKIAELARRTAGRAPYTGSRAFKNVFGASLGALWTDFERYCAEKATPAPDPAGHQLTHRGFIVNGPRFTPGDTSRVLYTARDPHGFPALRSIGLDGSGDKRVTSRYLGERTAAGQRTIYFDQLEIERGVALRGDLYAMDRASGRVRRLTHGARLTDPDLSPDERLLACVQVQPGRRALAVLSIDRVRSGAAGFLNVLISEPETQFAAPRWSPDERSIVVERRRLNGPSEIVVLDVASRAVRVLASSAQARNVTPSWAPDGRTVLFASDRDGLSFNLFAVDVRTGTLRQITDLTSGATSPELSPDGRTLVYVGYTIEGYDLFTMPFDAAAGSVVAPHDSPAHSGFVPIPTQGALKVTSTAYTPWSTLAPRFWLPALETGDGHVKLGAATGGTDVLGRHAYAVTATWRVGDDPVPGALSRGEPDILVYYAYDRWRPTFYAAASRATSFPIELSSLDGTPVQTGLRETRAEVGAFLPFRRVRHTTQLLASFNAERDEFRGVGAPDSRNRTAMRFAATFNSTKRFGYSVSFEQGVMASVASEHVRRGLGASGDADAVTAELRGYMRLGGTHNILAIRAGAATASGDVGVRRLFRLGGGGPNLDLFDFGSDALSLMRGYERDSFLGRHLTVANIDYRFPLLRIERGYGTLPIFARTLHAAVFLDAGNVWDDRFSWRDLKTSAGAELSLDAVTGYYVPLTYTFGVGWGHDRSGEVPDGRTFYFRIGYAF